MECSKVPPTWIWDKFAQQKHVRELFWCNRYTISCMFDESLKVFQEWSQKIAESPWRSFFIEITVETKRQFANCLTPQMTPTSCSTEDSAIRQFGNWMRFKQGSQQDFDVAFFQLRIF